MPLRNKLRRWATVSMACLVTMSVTPPTLATIPAPRDEQWWLRQWQAQDKIWPITRGRGVTVAVLDGGVDAQLPDLAGRVVAGGDTLDGSTNGLKDLDAVHHGTNIAGLIAAQGRGTGMVGVAPDSRILSIRMNNETNGSGSAQNMAKAIRSAVRQGAKVVNISLATPSDTGLVCDPIRQAAVDEALRRDVIIVAGAGNNIHTRNAPLQPASCPGVLAVGSLHRSGRPDHYSQPQPYVAIAAPGVDIAAIRFESFAPNGFVEKDLRGTSFATALISGVVALVRARYPKMPAREVLRRVTGTAKDVGPRGRDIKSGMGAVRPYEALTAQLAPGIPNPVYEAWEKSLRERALHPLPTATPSIPDVVPLRTRVIQVGAVAAALLFAGAGAAVSAAFVITRRRARPSPSYMRSDSRTVARK